MAKVQIPASLRQRMIDLGIQEEVLEEKFVRSGGAGGQNVNKVATCVQLYDSVHDMRVECQEHRTQLRNRVRARELLCDALEDRRQQESLRAGQLKHKEKARRRTRSEKEKREMVAQKRRDSERKRKRKVTESDFD
jgi:protein subunit release factor B